MNSFTSLIDFVKGKGIPDKTGEPMSDDNKEKVKLAKTRFCDLRLGKDGTEDEFDTFVNVCLFSLESVTA